MSIKAVILDLDGTLLNNNHEISNENKRVLKELVKKGIKVYLCSGRPYTSMLKYHDELELTTPIISFNGAKVLNPDGTLYHEESIEGDILKKLIEISRRENIHMNLYQGKDWLVENSKREEAKGYSEKTGLIPIEKDFKKLENLKSDKALYISSYERLQELQEEIRGSYPNDLDTIFSTRNYLEILKKGVNKGSTMKIVLEKEGISLEESISFGDGLNDKELLMVAGIGVAMENSFDGLKEVADEITVTNEEDGVAKVLKRYL